MPKIININPKKNPVTDIGAKISSIDLDQLVFKAEEKGNGKIYPDPKAIVENAKNPASRFNSCTDDANVEILYNDNVFKPDTYLIERLVSKEEVNERENTGTINPQTRAYSKHRAVSLPVVADAVCDGKTLNADEHYKYQLTIVNAPNAGNARKGNGPSSSPLDMQLYFTGKNTNNYKMAMKEIYKIALLAQRTSKTVVIPPIGLGVYLSGLEGRDLYYSAEFIKNDILNHRNDFTFIEKEQKLYFTNQDGQYQEIEKPNIDKINEFLAINEGRKSGVVHLHMGTIKSFGSDFEQFVKGLPLRSDRPQVTEVNKANYEALKEVIEDLEKAGSNTIKTIILCAVRKEGEELFQNLELKNIDVLQSKGDMLQTVQLIAKMNIPVGLLCAGSDHDIGGATGDCLVKIPQMIPGEEQTSLTSNFMNTLVNALNKGQVKYIPYSIDVCKQDFSQLPKQISNVSVSKFSILASEAVDVKTPSVDENSQLQLS